MKLGREAIKLLINRMAFPDRPKMEVVLDTKLIVNKLKKIYANTELSYLHIIFTQNRNRLHN